MRAAVAPPAKARPSWGGALEIGTLFVLVVGVRVRMDSSSAEASRWLRLLYGAMVADSGRCALEYQIWPSKAGICWSRDEQEFIARDMASFIYDFEKDLTIQVERLRSDLLFLHAAVIGYAGRAHIVAAPSGSGKSTTTWALLDHGFEYLSDELAPVDLDCMKVLRYPRALCLKARPPAPYGLPTEILDSGCTLHMAVDTGPAASPVGKAPMPIGSILFLQFRPEQDAPSMQRVSAGEATARLYANTLNALAHDNDGLAAAAKLASSCNQLYVVTSSGLSDTCRMLNRFAERLAVKEATGSVRGTGLPTSRRPNPRTWSER